MPTKRKASTAELPKRTRGAKKKEEAGPSEAEKRSKRSKKKGGEETDILEKGHIYFFYKPKVDEEEVRELSDVQRLFVILAPGTIKETKEKFEEHRRGRKSSKGLEKVASEGEKEGKGERTAEENKEGETTEKIAETTEKTAEEKNLIRMLVIGGKQMPKVNIHERLWGAVVMVTPDFKELDLALLPEDYETKTRGVRHQGVARPVAEGVFAITEHHGHTHLAYVLELPEEMGPVQKAFNLTKEGSFIISVKNPDIMFKREESKPPYPSDLLDLMQGKRWIPANPVQLLDYKGAEVMLIGAAEDLQEEFGQTGAEIEALEKMEHHDISDSKLFKELHLNKADFPVEPLHGKWK